MSSPIHVHVQDNTPLHVHVKKPKKTEIRDSQQLSARPSNLRHSVRSGPRGKLKPINDPWIPAPGKTSIKDKLDKQFKWESSKTQLEVNAPRLDINLHIPDEIPLKASDLSTEEDNKLRTHLTEYERKIETLMSEVGTLRNEASNISQALAHNKSCNVSSFKCESNTSGDAQSDAISVRPAYPLNHVKCFSKPEKVNETDERCAAALKKLVAKTKPSRSKWKCPTQAEKIEEIAKNLVVKTNSDPVIFVDSSARTDFENEEGDCQPKISLQSAFTKKLSSISEISNVGNQPVLSVSDWKKCSTPRKTDKMEVKKMEEELEKREELLEASHAALKDKEKELGYITKEFEETEKENMRLRKSVEKHTDDMAASLKEVSDLPSDKESLLHQLVEVEVNGVEAGKQVAALRDVAARLKYEKRLALSDVNLLSKQRELLLQKLDQFETSNRKVRRLLQSEHKTIGDVHRLEEQRDILIRKMADSDSEILRMRSELIQKRNDVEQLSSQVGEEKNHARTLNELNKSVEATRAHLQRELRTKEMENNRLHVQLKNMERDTDVARREAEELTAAARSEREMIAREKDGLKKATRSQRNRAEKAEDALRSLEERLEDRERKLEEARSQADAWRERYQRTADDKGRLDDHVQNLAQKSADLESALRSNELITQGKEDDYKQKIDRLSADNSAYRSDCERAKSDASLADERCRQAQKEAASLKSDLRLKENLEADLRAQLRKAKNEAEEALLNAERVERSSRRMRDDGNSEIERVREQMLDRMRDLQPLPELLKETEMKLQDVQDKLHVYEQRSAEQTRIIAELTNKSEDKADESSTLRQRIAALGDENRALEARLQILQVKLDDRDVRVKEGVLDTVGKDERIQQLQLKLEESNHEKASFKRQLEAAVADSRKAVEGEIEKAAVREHAAQARIIDLETQITRLKTDVASIKRSKEDCERKSQSKLQDAKDRLEQAESTNRSMRNYVDFLKTSYNNVFGDTSLTSTPIKKSDYSPY